MSAKLTQQQANVIIIPNNSSMSFTPSRALLILVLIWNLSKASCQIGVFRVIDGFISMPIEYAELSKA